MGARTARTRGLGRDLGRHRPAVLTTGEATWDENLLLFLDRSGYLLVWVVLAVVGFAVKSLFWLAIVGIVLFVVTGAVGAARRRSALR